MRRFALISKARSLTYRELNDRADQLAQVLQQKGVAANVSVAVWCDRPIDRSVAILGILKTGGTVLPLDRSTDSLERVAQTLRTVQPHLILTDADRRSELPPDAAQIVVLDAETAIVPHSRNPVAIAADTPAFLLDAGLNRVMLTHGNLVNASTAIAQACDLTEGDRVFAMGIDASQLLCRLESRSRCGCARTGFQSRQCFEALGSPPPKFWGTSGVLKVPQFWGI
ncbi:MAG: amino acid adenylation domain-containing protein [Leptolyngbyaceae cyanobacterium SM1_3_5]|nr:amino acid adenylation domain-containing protein [Leptolyngbyaceae cyanobacterium SM1_3_5]